MKRAIILTAWIVGIIVVVCLVTVIVVGEWYRGVTTLQSPPARPDLAGAADGLRTLAWADEGGVAYFAKVRMWILYDNRTGEDIKDLHFLSFETPGFDKVGDCWKGAVPSCYAAASETFKKTMVLGNGRTAVVYADLRPRLFFGRHGASGILVWKNSQGSDFYRAVILPGMEVHSEELDWVSGFVRAIEVCALPIVLAFLAWWLKFKQDQQEKAAKTEEARKIRLQETWNLQLPKVAKDVGEYYMPVYIGIQQLVKQTQKLNPSSGLDEFHKALFRLLRLIRRVDYLSEKVGGFSFKDHEGETLAAKCWDLFEEANRAQMSIAEEDGARVNDAIEPHVSLAQFMDLVNGAPETKLSEAQRQRIARGLENLTNCLKKWTKAGKFQEDLVPLKLLWFILGFETDRPLEVWYGKLPEFPSEKFVEAVDDLKLSKEQEKRYGSLKDNLRLYKDACEADVRRSLKDAGKTGADLQKPGQPQGSTTAAI